MNHKKTSILLTILILSLLNGCEKKETFADDNLAEIGTMIFGTIKEINDNQLMVNNISSNSVNGDVIVETNENCKIINAITGNPETLQNISSENFTAYIEPMMTLSYPPITTCEMLLVNYNDDRDVPQYAKIQEIKTSQDGYDINIGSGIIHIKKGTELASYDIPRLYFFKDLEKGHRILYWKNTDGSIRKVLVFEKNYTVYKNE